MEDTSSEEGGVRAKEPRAELANRADSGLEMNMDLGDTGSVLSLEVNGSCGPTEMQDYIDERDLPGSAVAGTNACPVEGHSGENCTKITQMMCVVS